MKQLYLLILLCPAVHAIAQTESEIRTHYQDVNRRIQESKEHGMEGSLYCNEWVTNKNLMSWPAVGIYQETTDFWYEDDPNHISIKERDPKTVLLKVEVKRRSASMVTNEEYLYKNARLVFYYNQETEEGKQWETRIWFNAKDMFKNMVKADGRELSPKDLATPEYSDFKPQPANVQRSGKLYQDLFTKNMVYQ
jgi:hypothetical protein